MWLVERVLDFRITRMKNKRDLSFFSSVIFESSNFNNHKESGDSDKLSYVQKRISRANI